MSNILATGPLRKMKTNLQSPVAYMLPIGEQFIAINDYLGEQFSLSYTGRIHCIHCGRESKKSFNQGYCYPCFKALAECDLCIMRPETCHFHLGTCRDEQWAQSHCMQSHYVYIANSSGLKVGITRGNQIPTRWMDQGARQAVAMFKVKNRFHSGLLESAIKKYVSDRTDWRKMLKGGEDLVDIKAKAQSIVDEASNDLEALKEQHQDLQWQVLDEEVVDITYPVITHPEKVASLNFDKTPEIYGVLQGIKGQYLIFDNGVINIRKFAGYEVSFSV